MEGTEDEIIDQAIDKTIEFIHSLGLSASLHEAGIDPNIVNTIVCRFEERGESWGEKKIGTPEVIKKILLLSSSHSF